MINDQEALPVPRTRIFVSTDGLFVVQWEANRVQDLLTGKYYPYSDEKFGTPIDDWELNQLKSKGVVQQYDQELVYLFSNPDVVQPPTITRSFYLNTSLSKALMRDVEQALREQGLDERFAVRAQEQYLVIRGHHGVAFSNFVEAEQAREVLAKKLPEYCRDSVVAFIEMNNMS